MSVSIEVNGLNEAQFKVSDLNISGAHDGIKNELKDFGRRSYEVLHAEAPGNSGGPLGRRLNMSKVRRYGDVFEVVVGVLRKFPDPLFPLFVHEGTGIHARDGMGGNREDGLIWARRDRGRATVVETRRYRRGYYGRGATKGERANGALRLVNRTTGEVYFRANVEGQKPNPFAERTYDISKHFSRRYGDAMAERALRRAM